MRGETKRDAALLAALALTLGLLGSGCERKQAQAAAETALPVRVERVGRGSVARVLERMGEVHGEVEVRVFSQIPDRILDLRVDEGDTLAKGDVIAVIQSETLTSGVAQVAASLESARAQRDRVASDLRRAEVLLQSAVTSAAQVEALRQGLAAADAQVRSLEAVVEQASTRQRQAVVRAPIAGVVGSRLLNRGDLAAPGMPIVTLVQMDRVKVVLQATEYELPYLRLGTPVEIRVAAHPGETFAGKVTRVSPVIHPLTRHAQVEMLLDNPDHKLRPGMLARVTAVLEQRAGVIVAPLFSLLMNDEQRQGEEASYHVFVLDGRVARRRNIVAGLIDGGQVEVREGLREGETLVVRGQQLLDDGSEVEVTVTPSAAAAAGEERGSLPPPAAPAAPPAAATPPSAPAAGAAGAQP